MKQIISMVIILAFLGCKKDDMQQSKKEIDWETLKNNVDLTVNPSNEYETPVRLSLNTLGWEDGAYVTRDGLTAYCFYTPLDLLSMSNPPSGPNSVNPCNVEPYMRGPSFGILDSVPTQMQGQCSKFLSSDILISHRNSINENFPFWSLSNIKNPASFDGAPQLILNSNNHNVVDYFVYVHLNPDQTQTSNNTSDIYWYKNTNRNPAGNLVHIPSPVYSTSYNEDNPHLKRTDDGTLVLFFTSTDRPNVVGSTDIFVSSSTNNGTDWSNPEPVNFNSTEFEDMPHIWKSPTGEYWMYHMAGPDIVKRKQLTQILERLGRKK